jgi:hypothetical protein
MKATKTEKRKVRSYKAVDSIYRRAKNKAVANKTTLAKKVEQFIADYAKV